MTVEATAATAGDATATTTVENAGEAATAAGTDPREAALGDVGKKLLQEMRTELKTAQDTIKELKGRADTQDTDAQKAKELELANAKKKELEEMDSIQRLEKQLAEEKAEREKFQNQYQERIQRDEFLLRAKSAGVREGTEVDLYDLVKGKLLDGVDISELLESQRTARPVFFEAKRGTQGHDGAAGTGGDGSGPSATADEARFAGLLGVKVDDYVKSR